MKSAWYIIARLPFRTKEETGYSLREIERTIAQELDLRMIARSIARKMRKIITLQRFQSKSRVIFRSLIRLFRAAYNGVHRVRDRDTCKTCEKPRNKPPPRQTKGFYAQSALLSSKDTHYPDVTSHALPWIARRMKIHWIEAIRVRDHARQRALWSFFDLSFIRRS